MGCAELIQQRLKILPQEKLAEAYNFVELIAARNPAVETLDQDQSKACCLCCMAHGLVGQRWARK